MAAHMPLITLEEHFTAEAAVKLYGEPSNMFGPVLGGKLVSLSDSRLADMDGGGIARQILSHTPFPSAPSPELCKDINNEIHRAVQAHPDRFSGFASLPMQDAAASAAELRRTVRELGFVGALVDTHVEGVWYDGPQWDAVWEAAVELDVPIYLHPCFASEEMMRVNYRGSYPEDVAVSLGAFVFGWHVETGLHFLRLFAAGVFDRWPKLKILIGHMGETLPFLLERQKKATGRWTHLNRLLDEVWRTNVWVTTSGMFDTAPLRCLLSVSPLDHVLFSLDYPFSNPETGREFVEEIEKQGVLQGEDLVAFTSGNAAKLLRVKA